MTLQIRAATAADAPECGRICFEAFAAIADAHKAILRARNHTGRSGCAFTVEFPVPSAKPTGVPA